MFETVMSILNQPVVITILAGIVLWALNKVYAKQPAWKQYEGTIIAGVKWAEKNIADDTKNKSLARLDAAMKYVLKVYEASNGSASDAVKAELKEGVQIIHSELEASGVLPISVEVVKGKSK